MKVISIGMRDFTWFLGYCWIFTTSCCGPLQFDLAAYLSCSQPA